MKCEWTYEKPVKYFVVKEKKNHIFTERRVHIGKVTDNGHMDTPGISKQ